VATNRWQRVEQIYHSALEQEESQRTAFLEQVCADNQDLRLEVESLLTYVKKTGKFIDKGALAVMAKELAGERSAHLDSPDQDPMIGKTIFQYRITAKLGSGGMGDVFRAVRADDAYEGHVALKLISAGHQSSFFISRFKTERQILASLDHPNVARLFDGGTTEDGVPYLVMEYIEGEPITAYCDQRRLSIGDRLKLFVQVCSAVQYAHQHLIIHRDIKPDNILVTADGTAKLMDFGIAKILDEEAESGQHETTMTGMRAFTPAYASPEQIKGEPISTASDVYSLGVVLYQILTGRSPYPISNLAQHELARAICEVEPEKPSTVVSSAPKANDKFSPESVSASRNTTPEKLRRSLAGDLDQILLKALRKEPQHRYASAQALADDLQAYALGLPVSARRGTFSYRAAKFIRRNKLSLTVAAIILLIMLAGAVAIVREARIARMEQQRAQRRFDSLRKLAHSLIFDIHDSIADLPGSTAARKLLVEEAVGYLDGLSQDIAGDRELQRELATAYTRVGDVQGYLYRSNLGDTSGAVKNYEKGLAIRERLAKIYPNDPKVERELAESYQKIAVAFRVLGQNSDSLQFFHRALERRKALAAADPSSESAQYDLANCETMLGDLIGDQDLAPALEQQSAAAAAFERLATEHPKNTDYSRMLGVLHVKLGALYESAGRLADAKQAYSSSIRVLEPLAAANPQNALIQRNLASAYADEGDTLAKMRRSEGVALLTKAANIQESLRSTDKANKRIYRDLALTYTELGGAERSCGRKDLAARYYKKAMEIAQALSAADPQSRDARGIVAMVHEESTKWNRAATQTGHEASAPGAK
jgi:eukaryotic-like serine/threonine-protein kinase